MGQSATGILTYGYDLGGIDTEWKLKDVDKYADIREAFSFIRPENEDEYEDIDFEDEVKHALHESGLHLWIDVERYCSYDYPGYILGAHSIQVYQGYAKSFNPMDPAFDYITWDQKLDTAIMILGIRPLQEKPSWLISTIYG